ncbi:MAG: thiamine pyrophosphate-dependent enzyme, partial [Candidatus Dadabacteria bacterium]|nr:thiamine pyrophosphate-dependent enzyme [Candidatus Dadabacteria bacterium]
NGMSPVTDAMLDSIPILFITGQVPTFLIGKGAFQEAPVTEMTIHTTKDSVLVRQIDTITEWIDYGYKLAMGTKDVSISERRQGPVHIDIPKDSSQTMIDYNKLQPFYFGKHPEFNIDEKVDEIFKQFKKSKRPIVYAGGGIISSGASSELVRFSNYTTVPVTTTVMGLGGFPGSHKNSIGMLGMHGTAYANFAINGSPNGKYKDGADFVLAIGVRFDDRVCGDFEKFARNAYIAHIDVDPKENGKNKKPNIFAHSDANYFLKKLNHKIEKNNFRPNISEWWNHIEKLKRNYPLFFDQWQDTYTGNEIPTQFVLKELYDLTKEDHPIVTTGVGQHQMWAAQYFLVDKPRHFLTSAGLGTMGFGLPAALGAQVANPDKLVMDLDGDRSFWMTANELETIARFDLPVKIVVFDNTGHGMVRQWQDNTYDGRYIASEYNNINYANYARLFEDLGKIPLKSRQIKYEKDVRNALKEMINYEGAYLLHIKVRFEHCRPMIESMKSIEHIKLQEKHS